MTIHIAADTTILDFQKAFTALFPYLKVEFFTRSHDEGAASWSKYMCFDRTMPLAKIGQIEGEKDFDFTPDMTVGTFEQALWAYFGLAVQVFRKSMSTFIETTSSDAWTLKQQNDSGDNAAHTLTEMFYEQRTNED